jgi:hypothetical protein
LTKYSIYIETKEWQQKKKKNDFKSTDTKSKFVASINYKNQTNIFSFETIYVSITSTALIS